MSHGITRTDRFSEVRSGGRRAWHGLGIEIPDGLTAVEGFPLTGLDWDEVLLPTYAEHSGRRIQLEMQAHVRVDTGEVLGTVGPDYRPVKNLELAQFADALLGEDRAMVLETAGSLLGGRRVFACLRIPGGTFEAAPGDVVHQYMLVSNGHGGFAALLGGTTSVRVVCKNTHTMAERDLGRSFRIFHTSSLEKRLAQARLMLGTAQAEVRRFEEQARALVAMQLSDRDTEAFLHAAFVEIWGDPNDTSLAPDMRDRMLVKSQEMYEVWMNLLANERNSMPGIRGTLWAAYNAVSEWIDHDRGNLKDDARVHNNVFGASAANKRKIFRKALQGV